MRLKVEIDSSDYTFDASAKTIVFTGITGLSLEHFSLITNVTDNIVIYQFQKTGKGATFASNTLTLEHDTTSMSDSDKLKINATVSIDQIVQPVEVTSHPVVVPKFFTRSDTYTVAGNGVTVNTATSPVQNYSMQIKGTGEAPTSWDIRLEGSLDGTNFTKILQHTTETGDGEVLFSGSLEAPALYIRSRAHALVLGSATNVIVTLLVTVI